MLEGGKTLCRLETVRNGGYASMFWVDLTCLGSWMLSSANMETTRRASAHTSMLWVSSVVHPGNGKSEEAGIVVCG